MPEDGGRLLVSCPLSALPSRGLHDASYDPETGEWECGACGLAGTVQGFALLTELEAELSSLRDQRALWLWHSLLDLR